MRDDGAHPLGDDPEAGFRAYMAAFNADDFERFADFYDEDVEFVGQAATLRGRAAVADFYRGVKARVTETVTVKAVIARADLLAAEIETRLEAREDWPDFPTGPLRRGDVRASLNFVFYDIAAGRFARIRSARHRLLTPDEVATR